MPTPYQVGCYYFPNYHVDPRNEQVHGKGWTEWELVKHATPRFEGHQQPSVPLWGYVDEADSGVMEKKIAAAADHGIDYWVFDWYWYDDGPYLDRCLERGYFGAANNHRVKFCCMWANHDWIDIHPTKLQDPRRLLYPGKVTPDTFRAICDHIVEKYFRHPSHFMLDGCPYFSVYELTKLMETFGSVAETRRALDEFRRKTRSAGFPDLHLNAVVWGRPILPGEGTPADPVRLVSDLGFDSVTSYVWIHHVPLNQSPLTPFETVRDEYLKYWDRAEQDFGVSYFPNVSVGWDSSARTVQSEKWDPSAGYPFTNCIGGNTPAAFRQALQLTKQRLDQRDGPRVLNINCWNEWTEGSYLEPDTRNQMASLEAVRAVFAARP